MNGIERDLQDQAEVVRINRLSRLGRELARRYDVRSATSTLVFDRQGKLVFRDAGLPNRRAVVDAVRSG